MGMKWGHVRMRMTKATLALIRALVSKWLFLWNDAQADCVHVSRNELRAPELLLRFNLNLSGQYHLSERLLILNSQMIHPRSDRQRFPTTIGKLAFPLPKGIIRDQDLFRCSKPVWDLSLLVLALLHNAKNTTCFEEKTNTHETKGEQNTDMSGDNDDENKQKNSPKAREHNTIQMYVKSHRDIPHTPSGQFISISALKQSISFA